MYLRTIYTFKNGKHLAQIQLLFFNFRFRQVQKIKTLPVQFLLKTLNRTNQIEDFIVVTEPVYDEDNDRIFFAVSSNIKEKFQYHCIDKVTRSWIATNKGDLTNYYRFNHETNKFDQSKLSNDDFTETLRRNDIDANCFDWDINYSEIQISETVLRFRVSNQEFIDVNRKNIFLNSTKTKLDEIDIDDIEKSDRVFMASTISTFYEDNRIEAIYQLKNHTKIKKYFGKNVENFMITSRFLLEINHHNLDQQKSLKISRQCLYNIPKK